MLHRTINISSYASQPEILTHRAISCACTSSASRSGQGPRLSIVIVISILASVKNELYGRPRQTGQSFISPSIHASVDQQSFVPMYPINHFH